MKIVKRQALPKCIRQFKKLKGICVGKCISGKDLDLKKEVAHAHAFNDIYKGWICLHYKYQLKEKLVLLHEVAHLIGNNKIKHLPHGKEWKKVVQNIGGTFKPFKYIFKGKPEISPDLTYRHY